MRRLILLGLVLAAAALGCRSAEKNEAVGAAEPSWRKLPEMLTTPDWWTKGEMGDVELQ